MSDNMEDILEFCRVDHIDKINEATQQQLLEQATTFLEQTDPGLLDMIYTHEVFQILNESEKITTMEDFKEKINELIHKSTTPVIYPKMLKVFVSVAVIALGIGGGYFGARIGSMFPGAIAQYLGKLPGGGSYAVDSRTKIIGGIITGLIGVTVGPLVIGQLVRGIGYWILHICTLMCGSDYTPNEKISAIDEMLPYIKKAKSSFKDEKNQQYFEKAEEKLLAERDRLKENDF